MIVGGAPWMADAAVARLTDLERRWSRFRPDSEISAANAAAGRWTVVAPETLALVERAETARSHTGGRFDPTQLHEVVAAGYDCSFELVAGPEATAAAEGPPRRDPVPMVTRAAPVDRSVLVDRSSCSILVPAGVGFDPGGIGKGFAADLLVSELLGEGAAGACVSLGGDVRVGGVGPDGEDWIVEVADPRRDDDTPLLSLRLHEGAVATSSRRRRRWRDRAGREMHHLIDPSTGRPARTATLAATVVAAEAWQAEALAKVAFTAPAATFVAALADAGATGLLVIDDEVVRAPELARFALAPSGRTT